MSDDHRALIEEAREHKRCECAGDHTGMCQPICVKDGWRWPCLTARLAEALGQQDEKLNSAYLQRDGAQIALKQAQARAERLAEGIKNLERVTDKRDDWEFCAVCSHWMDARHPKAGHAADCRLVPLLSAALGLASRGESDEA